MPQWRIIEEKIDCVGDRSTEGVKRTKKREEKRKRKVELKFYKNLYWIERRPVRRKSTSSKITLSKYRKHRTWSENGKGHRLTSPSSYHKYPIYSSRWSRAFWRSTYWPISFWASAFWASAFWAIAFWASWVTFTTQLSATKLKRKSLIFMLRSFFAFSVSGSSFTSSWYFFTL